MHRLSLVVLLATVSSGALPAQDADVPEAFRSVHAFISAGISAGKTPSVAIAVIDENRTIWTAGYGYADVENKRKATPDSIYLLASVSKPMLATGLMKLVDDGKIDLDAPANGYLGKAKIRSSITDPNLIRVRELANHTAGLPEHWNFFYNGVKPPSREETIRRYAFAIQSPGAAWGYCNLAFGILDHIVTRQSGKPWGRYLEEVVFDPAGMARTSNRVRPGFEKDATRQYDIDSAGRFVRVGAYAFDHGGASACWSTANDLARFLLLHLNGGQIDGTRILSQKSAREMLVRTSNRPSKDHSGNAVAWFIGEHRGNPSFYHGGGMPGVSTHIRGFPDSRSGIVVLTNSSNHAFKNEIIERLCAALMPAGKTAPPRQVRELTEETREEFAGSWKGMLRHHQADVPIEIVIPEDGAITIRLGKGPARQLPGGAIRNEALVGTLHGVKIATQPSFHGSVDLEFELRLMMHQLMGRATAKADGYFALSHLVELRGTKK
jgi:CubicO group peptidase (beta-lactamase class C family)